MHRREFRLFWTWKSRRRTGRPILPAHVRALIQEVVTAPRSPWQNAYLKRFIGSIRRECLDHVIVLSAAGLWRVLNDYIAPYTRSRTHLSLD